MSSPFFNASPPTITEFLRDRIAEAEKQARFFDGVPAAHYEVSEIEASPEYATVYVPPNLVLAECEAKRRIVDEFDARDSDTDLMLGPAVLRRIEWAGLWLAVRILASSYSDHPAFRQEWAP